uniref:GRIP domain-containing protein n=1 Tax=Angiostrongylus cantonensis TaxID=6313 RepID=A0A0K0CW84_ANGCA
MAAKFRKAFPLREESAFRKPTPVAAPSLSQISKRLNFDDSFSSASVISPNVKLVELKEEVDSLKRHLNIARGDIQRLKSSEDTEKKKSELLQLEIVQLKKDKEVIKQKNLHELMKGAIFTLEELDSSLEEGTEHSKELLDTSAAGGSVYRDNEDNDVSANAGAVIVEGNQSILFNQSESVLNTTLAYTSIDYEKDERIQRLELENSRLQDRCNAEFNSLRSACARKMFDITDCSSQDRAAEVIKRIQSLSESVEMLEKERDNARLEAEKANKNGESLMNERDVLLKNIEHLTNVNENLKCSLNGEKEICAALERTVEMKNAELLCIQDEVATLREHSQSKITDVELKLQNATAMPTDAGNETQILHLRNNPLQSAVNSLGEAERERLHKRKAVLLAKIFRLQFYLVNKFKSYAQSEKLQPFLARDTNVSTGESSGVKRVREEHISALENQLKKSEREREQAIRIQADIAKKYRYIGERHSIPGFLAAVTLQLEARRGIEDVERTDIIGIVHED